MNLNSYSLPQLRQLQARLVRELAKRDTSKKEELLKQFEKLARAEGLSLADVLDAGAPSGKPKLRLVGATPKPAKEPLPAKYRHPADPSLNWSGRGRQPLWMTTFLANGGTTSALEEAARKAAMKVAAKSNTLKAAMKPARAVAPETVQSEPVAEQSAPEAAGAAG